MKYEKKEYHLFRKKGITLLFTIRDMRLFWADDIVEKVLSLPSPLSEQSAIHALPDVQKEDVTTALDELSQCGVLSIVGEDIIGEKVTVSQTQDTGDLPINGVWLVVSQDCNLRCTYCSAGYGTFGSDPTMMTKVVAQKAADLLIDREHEYPMNKKMLVFVGGEPLLNFPVIKFTVEYLMEQTHQLPKMGMDTNGTVITKEQMRFFIENNFDVTFSIDGNAQMHNANRFFPDGRGSYDIVSRNFRDYVKLKSDLTGKGGARVQLSLPDGKHLRKAVRHLISLGATVFVANPTGSSYFLQKKYPLSRSNMLSFYREFETLNDEFLRREYGKDKHLLFNATATMLEKIHKRGAAVGCGAGYSIAISAHGKIYPCQGLVGMDEFLIGDINNGINVDKRREFIYNKINFERKCNTCWARTLCRAACIAAAFVDETVDDIHAEPTERCELYRKYIETGLYTYYIARRNMRSTPFSEKHEQIHV